MIASKPMIVFSKQPIPEPPLNNTPRISVKVVPRNLPKTYKTIKTTTSTMNQVGAVMTVYFFLPVTALMIADPIFRSNPCFVIGMPVFLAMLCLTCVMPSALLSENDTPGILLMVLVILR